MGFSRYYFKEHNFLFTKISGKVEDEDLQQHVGAVNKETEGVVNLRQLTDCREITDIEELTVPGTTRCAQGESNKPGSKLAVLVPDSPLIFGMVRAYTMFAEEHRGAIKIFNNIQEALVWLANEQSEINILEEFVNTIK